jgi:hypothetical protein
MMKRFAPVAIVSLVAGACSLNPQPLPPATGLDNASGRGGSDAGSSLEAGAGESDEDSSALADSTSTPAPPAGDAAGTTDGNADSRASDVESPDGSDGGPEQDGAEAGGDGSPAGRDGASD